MHANARHRRSWAIGLAIVEVPCYLFIALISAMGSDSPRSGSLPEVLFAGALAFVPLELICNYRAWKHAEDSAEKRAYSIWLRIPVAPLVLFVLILLLLSAASSSKTVQDVLRGL